MAVSIAVAETTNIFMLQISDEVLHFPFNILFYLFINLPLCASLREGLSRLKVQVV